MLLAVRLKHGMVPFGTRARTARYQYHTASHVVTLLHAVLRVVVPYRTIFEWWILGHSFLLFGRSGRTSLNGVQERNYEFLPYGTGVVDPWSSSKYTKTTFGTGVNIELLVLENTKYSPIKIFQSWAITSHEQSWVKRVTVGCGRRVMYNACQ